MDKKRQGKEHTNRYVDGGVKVKKGRDDYELERDRWKAINTNVRCGRIDVNQLEDYDDEEDRQ